MTVRQGCPPTGRQILQFLNHLGKYRPPCPQLEQRMGGGSVVQRPGRFAIATSSSMERASGSASMVSPIQRGGAGGGVAIAKPVATMLDRSAWRRSLASLRFTRQRSYSFVLGAMPRDWQKASSCWASFSGLVSTSQPPSVDVTNAEAKKRTEMRMGNRGDVCLYDSMSLAIHVNRKSIKLEQNRMYR